MIIHSNQIKFHEFNSITSKQVFHAPSLHPGRGWNPMTIVFLEQILALVSVNSEEDLNSRDTSRHNFKCYT